VGREQKKKERRSSSDSALLLKLHKAVDDGGVAARTVGVNGGGEAVFTGKVAAATVRRRSARSRPRPGREADDRSPRGFRFSLNCPNWLKHEN
jgi:hypothetical protein